MTTALYTHSTLAIDEGCQWYNENDQYNTIKFSAAVEHKEKQGTFYRLSGLFECRDFFNDMLLSFYRQKDNPVYGFQTDVIPNIAFDCKKELHLVLSGIEKPEHTVMVVNSILKAYKMRPLKYIKVDKHDSLVHSQHDEDEFLDRQFLVKAPSYWWNNSFNVALLTALFRHVTNNTDWEDEAVDAIPYWLEMDIEQTPKYVRKLPKLTSRTAFFTGQYHTSCNHVHHDTGLACITRGVADPQYQGYNSIIKRLKKLIAGEKE